MGYCCRGDTAVGNTAEEDTGSMATVRVQVAEEFERIGNGKGNWRGKEQGWLVRSSGTIC